MSNKTICPACHQELNTPLRPDFLLCSDCGIAVRVPSTIPATTDRLSVYSEDWIKAHSRNPIAQDVAKSVAGVVRSVLSSGQADILDIGCGSGVLVDRLAQSGHNAVGIDWSEPAIEYANHHHKGTYIWTNVENGLPHRQTFDLAVASHIMEHLVDPHSFLRSVAKLLKPSGYLVIAIPNLNWYDPDSMWRSVSTLFDGEHVVGYTPPGLQMVLNQSGFDVVGMTTKTHRTAILTAIGVSLYGKLRKGKESHQGAIQQAYGGITNNPVVSAILSAGLAPFNWMTERKLRGMELVVVARIERSWVSTYPVRSERSLDKDVAGGVP